MPNVDYRQFVDRFQSIERRLRNIELRPNPQLAVATGKTLTVDHSMTLTGADGFTLTIPETGTAVLSDITISAGDGMSGGGNLTANRTLSVNQDYDFNWTGLHTFGEHTEMESVDVNGALTVFDDLSVFHGGFYPLYVNVDTVNPNNSNVGIMTNSPDPQFALDVAGPLRAQYLIGPHAIQLSDAALIAHFDGPYPFETNYDGFAAGHLGQVATTTGGVIYRPGKFGKAVQLAEATTNLVTNPSFEGWDGANPNGWSLVNSPTIAQSSESMYGSLGARVTNNSTALDRGLWVEVSGLTIGLTYTFSAWVYNIVGQSRIRVFQGGSFTTAIAASSYTSGSGWQRLSVSFAAPTTSVRVLLAATSAGADCVYDAIQIEAKAYATPYCDGSLGNGHTWAGTAHASTSSRTAASLTYATANNIDATVCTVMAWVYATNTAGYQTILRANGSSATYIILRYNAGDTQYQAFWGGNAITGGTAKFNQWVHLAATFDGSTVTLYENGVEVASGAAGTAFAGMPTVMHIGDRPAGGHNLNGYLDDLVILSRAADADEIRSIYESDAPVFAESSIEVWRTPTAIPIWVDSEGMWMQAVGGGETLGAYGGDATKSWGGKTLYQSDFLLGNATDGYIHWHAFQDDSDPWGAAGMEVKAEMDIIGNSTVSGVLSVTGGSIKAGGGAVTLADDGFRLAVGTGTPNRIRWMNSATERASVNGFDSGGVASVSVLAGQNVATAYPGSVLLTASEGGGSLGFARLSLDGPGNQAVVQFDDNDGRFKVQRTGPTVWLEVAPTDTRFGGSLTLPEMSSTPAMPTSGTQMRAYMKTDKFVIQYNDGGTVRYKYLDLTGTGVTWVHTTTAP